MWQINSSRIVNPGTQFSGWRIKIVEKRQVAPSMMDWWVNINRIMGEKSWRNETQFIAKLLNDKDRNVCKFNPPHYFMSLITEQKDVYRGKLREI